RRRPLVPTVLESAVSRDCTATHGCHQTRSSNSALKKQNPQSKIQEEPGGETSKLRDDSSEAAAKGRSPPRSPWRGEFWQRLAAVLVPFDASPHPSAFGGHPLPQGEREESLFALPR